MSSVIAYGTFVKYGVDIYRTATYLQWGNSDNLIGACVLCNPGIAVLEARGLYIHGPVNEGREFSGPIKLNGHIEQVSKLVEKLYEGQTLEGILYVYNLFTLLDASTEVFLRENAKEHQRQVIHRDFDNFIAFSDEFPWVLLAWGCDSRTAAYSEKLRWMEAIKKHNVPYIGVEGLAYPDFLAPLQQWEWGQSKYFESIAKQFVIKNISLTKRVIDKRVIQKIVKNKNMSKMKQSKRLFGFMHEPLEEKVEIPDEEDNILETEGIYSKEHYIQENIELLNTKQYEAALQNCLKAIEIDDKYLPAYIQKANILELTGDTEGAVKCLGEVLLKTKDMKLQSLYDAKVTEYRGEYDKAINGYIEAIQVVENSEDSNLHNGEVLLYLNNSIGKLLHKIENYEEAVQYFNLAAKVRDCAEAAENREKAMGCIVKEPNVKSEDFDYLDRRTLEISTIFRISGEAKSAADISSKDTQSAEVIVQAQEQEKLEDEQEDQGSEEWLKLKEKIKSFIGLSNVKRELYSIMNYLHYERKRSKVLNLSEENLSYHFMFTGNPGTGKTTVARLLGEILVKAGVLNKGHVIEVDRSKIVGQYVGQTAVLTKKAIESAMDGILFIDEAYSLYRSDSPNDYGIEAVDTLVKAMEDYRGKFVVIFAGYSRELSKLMQLNPGLKSRINVQIPFEDYTEEELLSIGKKLAAERHYELDPGAEEAFYRKLNKLRVDSSFANGRTVRNIIEDAIREKAYRTGSRSVSEVELRTLSAEDFGIEAKTPEDKGVSGIIDELNSLTGLSEIKSMIKEIVDFIQLQNRRKELGFKTKDIALNMVFAGNPGTGKTTVARIISRLFKELGILKLGQLIEVSREDLVGEYIGQTSSKALDKIKEAYGGVLFIDEAYTLASGGENDYGKEALAALIKEMEDNRDKLTVIMAGYTDEMRELLNLNPGLKSRIGFNIQFPDYNPSELLNIFKAFCHNNDYVLSEGAEKLITDKIIQLHVRKDKRFGNARTVRQLFEKVRMKQANRVMSEGAVIKNPEELITITEEDVLGIENI